jgi:hypothetical protein
MQVLCCWRKLSEELFEPLKKITEIRQDPAAKTNSLVIEKDQNECSYYLNPELYDQPVESACIEQEIEERRFLKKAQRGIKILAEVKSLLLLFLICCCYYYLVSGPITSWPWYCTRWSWTVSGFDSCHPTPTAYPLHSECFCFDILLSSVTIYFSLT